MKHRSCLVLGKTHESCISTSCHQMRKKDKRRARIKGQEFSSTTAIKIFFDYFEADSVTGTGMFDDLHSLYKWSLL